MVGIEPTSITPKAIILSFVLHLGYSLMVKTLVCQVKKYGFKSHYPRILRKHTQLNWQSNSLLNYRFWVQVPMYASFYYSIKMIIKFVNLDYILKVKCDICIVKLKVQLLLVPQFSSSSGLGRHPFTVKTRVQISQKSQKISFFFNKINKKAFLKRKK